MFPIAGAILEPCGVEHPGGILAASHLHDLPLAGSSSSDRRRHGEPHRRHHQPQGPDGLQPGGETGAAKAAWLQRPRRHPEAPAVGDERDSHRVTRRTEPGAGRGRRVHTSVYIYMAKVL